MKSATCHPGRKHHTKGLCRECYDATPARHAYQSTYSAAMRERVARINLKARLLLEQWKTLEAKP